MPYKSKVQAAYFNIHKKKLERQGVDVDHWNEVSKGLDLPERIKKAGKEVFRRFFDIDPDRARYNSYRRPQERINEVVGRAAMNEPKLDLESSVTTGSEVADVHKSASYHQLIHEDKGNIFDMIQKRSEDRPSEGRFFRKDPVNQKAEKGSGREGLPTKRDNDHEDPGTGY